VRREKKGRGGKTVTTATGIPLVGGELTELAKSLRRRCGSGGTLKEGIVEIQGDHVDTIITALTEAGFEVKRSGG
jgi:translation initiation factor 1